MLTDEQEIQLLFLKMRDTIADKEWYIANANRDISVGGEWTCDWQRPIDAANIYLENICKKLEENKS